MPKPVAVLLSGCGFYDGSEIQEATFTLLALDQAGLAYQCCAPDKPQADVIDHLRGQPANESRHILREAARIARGKILPLWEIHSSDYSAIMLPGGYGAAKNLCTYATDGRQSKVDPEVARVLQEFHEDKKPIAAVCIAPIILASVFNGSNLTIGNDETTSKDIEALGAHHQNCPVTDFVIDQKNRIITSPAYMYDATPKQVFEGISKTVGELKKMLTEN